ncbi:hypothetical protein EW146_g2481 [Bondarzewia mesenterica]|uniref:Uncharacterized protein n=1 Tax=Bondarzewia mesenterica TaxID=1095465 RepID=A0A4S4M6P0_9AGAM|nr:hypothetical protein EW146_g2481 [Bondarzewia mesenterica]
MHTWALQVQASLCSTGSGSSQSRHARVYVHEELVLGGPPDLGAPPGNHARAPHVVARYFSVGTSCSGEGTRSSSTNANHGDKGQGRSRFAMNLCEFSADRDATLADGRVGGLESVLGAGDVGVVGKGLGGRGGTFDDK